MYVAVLSFTKINSTISCSQISCVTASTELQDRVRFPRYFQLHPAEETMALAYFAVIKEYGWNQVSLIVQKERLFTLVRLAHTSMHMHTYTVVYMNRCTYSHTSSN